MYCTNRLCVCVCVCTDGLYPHKICFMWSRYWYKMVFRISLSLMSEQLLAKIAFTWRPSPGKPALRREMPAPSGSWKRDQRWETGEAGRDNGNPWDFLGSPVPLESFPVRVVHNPILCFRRCVVWALCEGGFARGSTRRQRATLGGLFQLFWQEMVRA